MIVAEISVVPIGEGTSVGRYVRLAVNAIKSSGVKYHISPMGTCFETATLESAMEIAKRAHQAVLAAGAKRVVTTLKIDERIDAEHSMEKKVRSAAGE
jgi:uncharacterized protein (TIGR00106 family)